MRVAVWNSEWASSRSPRRERIIHRLADLSADILCITEGYRDLLPQHGSVIGSDPDYGYPVIEGRRKVLLWSRHDWIFVDQLGSTTMPEGRFVSGITNTPIGSLTVLGVCIPWSMAHVTSGRRDRNPWEDHLVYLEGLREVLLQHQGQPLLVVGDFNQTIPRTRQPRTVFESLASTFDGLMEIATAGYHPELDKPLIDHVAHSSNLKCLCVTVLSRFDDDGIRLSDHSGVVVELQLKPHENQRL